MNPYVPLSVSSISFMYYSLFLNSFTFCLEEHGLSTPSSTAIVPLQKSGPRAALEGHSQLQHSLSLSLTCSLTRSKAAGNPPPRASTSAHETYTRAFEHVRPLRPPIPICRDSGISSKSVRIKGNER